MPPVADWLPAAADVGAVLRARTVDANGSETGTFGLLTRPTAAQTALLAQSAAEGAAAAIGGIELPAAMWPAAKMVATLGTALLVELSYFPEQISTGRSPYEHLRALYTEALAALRAYAESLLIDVPGEAGLRPMPAWSYPDPVLTLDDRP